MKQTEYTVSGGRFGKRLLFALISDLHGADPAPILEALKEKRPDYILMPGDIFERLNGEDTPARRRALTLLRESAALAPVLYSTGNHEDGGVRSWDPRWKNRVKERSYHPKDLKEIAESGAILLDDSFVLKCGIAFGGLSSGLILEGGRPNTDWLAEFCSVDAPKVLLCHHPEYYEKYLKNLPIDLIVSGHAHGGQWRFFGRGVFAPGQGIFPKYTAGVHDDRFVISRGLKPSGTIPRIFNEPEVVFVRA